MPTSKSDLTPRLGIIGGSGLYCLQPGAEATLHEVMTPYADKPVPLMLEATPHGPVWFLPRHGRDHDIAPHEINYRANLWALHAAGALHVVAVNAVGGITPRMAPGALVLPDQIIDYSWGREHTYCTGRHAFDRHVDFTWPYSTGISRVLLQAAQACALAVQDGGVYACTQGPRLESAAEVRRLANDGCDIVGMTSMPEAGLARELGLEYGCLALVVNRAAGLTDAPISLDDIKQVMASGIADVRRLLQHALPTLLALD